MLTKIKTYFISALFGIMAVGYILWSTFTAGKKSQKSDQQKEVIDNVKQAKESSDNSSAMSDDERIERMRERTRK